MTPRNRKGFWLVYLLFLVLFIEGGLQVVYRIQNGLWLWDDSNNRVDYALRVSDRREYALLPNYDDGKISIDADGFRLPPPTSNTQVIVCAGDSVPFGYRVANTESYCALLAQKGYHTLNAGIPSYDLRQSFDRVLLDVLPRYPDTKVAVIQSVNDAPLLLGFAQNWTPDRTWASARMTGRANKSALVYYLANIVTKLTVRSGIPTDAWLANLRSVAMGGIRALKAKGVRVILVSANPFYYQSGPGIERNPSLPQWVEYQKFYDAYSPLIPQQNAILREVAQTEGADYLDVASAFDALDRSTLFIDDVHLTPQGAQIEADLIAALLDKPGD